MRSTTGQLLLLVVVVGCFCHQILRVKAANSRRFLLREEPCHCESDCKCEQGHCVNNKCQCNFGWAGTDCGIQASIVPNTPKPTAVVLPNVHHDCGNHGHFNGTECNCSSGWSGARCQHAPGTRHECYDPSCMHGVRLWWLDSSGNEHQDCHCDDEYVGENCTYSNHPSGKEYLCADQSVCEHGVCVHNTQYSPYNYYACKCEAGWHGDHCDENNPVPETVFCDGKMCRHGTCNQYWHNGQYQYGCKCDPGWTGEHCDTEEFSRCGNLSCLHGTCNYNRDRYGNHVNHHCVCTESWYGKSCDHRTAGTASLFTPAPDLCANNPCGTHGNCTSDANGYQCACVTGWGGKKCEIDTTPSCNHLCVIEPFATVHSVFNDSALKCKDSHRGSNEALPMTCCGIGQENTWFKGLQVIAHCSGTSALPKYTPIASFKSGRPADDTSGVLLRCETNGFEYIRQTCDATPHIIAVNGSNGMDPSSFFVIY